MGRGRGHKRQHGQVATRPNPPTTPRPSESASRQANDDLHVAAMREERLLEFGTYQSDTLPTHVLEGIIRVLPDAAPVLLDEMKANAAHRRTMETAASAAREGRLNRGQIGAYVLAVVGVASSTAVLIASNGALWAFIYGVFALALSIGGPPAAKIFLEHNRMSRTERANEES